MRFNEEDVLIRIKEQGRHDSKTQNETPYKSLLIPPLLYCPVGTLIFIDYHVNGSPSRKERNVGTILWVEKCTLGHGLKIFCS